jgi:hypothetical protein
MPLSFVDWQKRWIVRFVKTGSTLGSGNELTFEDDPRAIGLKRIVIQGRLLPWAEGCGYNPARDEVTGAFQGKEFTIKRSASGLVCTFDRDETVIDPTGGGTNVSWTAEEGSGTKPVREDPPHPHSAI